MILARRTANKWKRAKNLSRKKIRRLLQTLAHQIKSPTIYENIWCILNVNIISKAILAQRKCISLNLTDLIVELRPKSLNNEAIARAWDILVHWCSGRRSGFWKAEINLILHGTWDQQPRRSVGARANHSKQLRAKHGQGLSIVTQPGCWKSGKFRRQQSFDKHLLKQITH